MDRAVNGMQTAQRNTSENALRQGKTMLLVFEDSQHGVIVQQFLLDCS